MAQNGQNNYYLYNIVMKIEKISLRDIMRQIIKSFFTSISIIIVMSTYGLAQQAVIIDADDNNTADSWSFEGDIYGWVAGIEAESPGGGKVKVSTSDILNNLDMAFMGSIIARKGKLSIFSDLIYLNMGAKEKTTVNAVGQSTKVRTKFTIKNWINTTGVGYSLIDNGSTQLSGHAGFRYLKFKEKISLDIGQFGRSKSGDTDFFDGIVGFRGTTELNDRLYLSYYADIGTGQSDMTYQLFAGLNYRFNKWDAVVGYRYMNWDLGNDGFVEDLTVSGPLIGARFRF